MEDIIFTIVIIAVVIIGFLGAERFGRFINDSFNHSLIPSSKKKNHKH